MKTAGGCCRPWCCWGQIGVYCYQDSTAKLLLVCVEPLFNVAVILFAVLLCIFAVNIYMSVSTDDLVYVCYK
jgi:hypothetical protein